MKKEEGHKAWATRHSLSKNLQNHPSHFYAGQTKEANMNPNVQDLYAGLSGLVLVPERYELGQGVTISQTYAHFMAPFLMAFAPAAEGKHHPAPWKSAKGGYAVDITAELFLPATYSLEHLDRLNTVWWIAALLRLKATALVFVPVISSERFGAIPAIEQEPELWPQEIYMHRLLPERELNPRLGIPELEWLKAHWQDASVLLANEDFSIAIQAVDLSIWGTNPALALVAVWGALERLFSSSNQELSFRVSANIAAYLESPGRERYKCFKEVKALYDHRSKAAHGEGKADITPYVETFAIARRALLKMVETRHVPGKKELEARLFNDEIGITNGTSALQ